MPSSIPQTVGQRKDPCLPSRKGTVPALGHSRGKVLLAGAARRHQVREVLAKHRTGHPTTQARPRVVDARPRIQERRPHLETNQKRIFTLRFERLRMGCCAKRLRRGPRFLADAKYRGAHNLQGAEGSALCHPCVPSRAQRTKSSFTRGQPVRHRRPHPPHLQVPHDDVRAPKIVPLDIDTYDIKIRT